jgi:hypothetical protein
MGLRRIIADLDFRRVAAIARNIWRGWTPADMASLQLKLTHAGPHWSSGMIKLTARECRALVEVNTRAEKVAVASPLLVWIEGRGLRTMASKATEPSPPLKPGNPIDYEYR